MATITEQSQKWLLKKYHSLCFRLNMSADDKLALLAGYGVESSVDLSNEELTQICDRLNAALNPESAKTDRLRKRVIAAIGGWLRLTGAGKEDIGYIKGIACQATGVDRFNRIPYERLRNLYNMFLKKQRDAKAVNAVCARIENAHRFRGELPGLN